MQHVAQIEGVQDIILRKLPSAHLPKMLYLSREWMEPSIFRTRQRIEQLTEEFSQDLGEETGVHHDARTKFGWKRRFSPSTHSRRTLLGLPPRRDGLPMGLCDYDERCGLAQQPQKCFQSHKTSTQSSLHQLPFRFTHS
jgi:hypothetical protein